MGKITLSSLTAPSRYNLFQYNTKLGWILTAPWPGSIPRPSMRGNNIALVNRRICYTDNDCTCLVEAREANLTLNEAHERKGLSCVYEPAKCCICEKKLCRAKLLLKCKWMWGCVLIAGSILLKYPDSLSSAANKSLIEFFIQSLLVSSFFPPFWHTMHPQRKETGDVYDHMLTQQHSCQQTSLHLDPLHQMQNNS